MHVFHKLIEMHDKVYTPTTHTRTHSYSLTHSLTHVHSYSLTHTHSHSLTHSLTHTRTFTLTHSLTEEEPQGGGARVTMERGRHSSVEDRGGGGGVSVFTTIGTLILTSRPYDSLTKRYPSDEVCPSPSSAIVDSHRASLQGEIFQSVNKEVVIDSAPIDTTPH